MKAKATGSLTLDKYLKVAAARYGDREAIYCSMTDRRFTFRQIYERTNGLANGLLSLGLKKGDVCAFLCYNRVEIIETYFALAQLGVLGVPLNYRLSPTEMIELMDYCKAENIIFDPGFTEIVSGMKKDLSGIKQYICIGPDVPDFATSYDELVEKSSKEDTNVEISEEDYQYYNLTSGTTGLPKAYLLTHYNNASAAAIMAYAHDVTENDVILTVFPIFGRVGLAWCAIGLFTGARNVIHQFGLPQMLELIQQEKVTISNWVPTIANFVLMLPDLDKYDFSSLRGLVFAASPFPPSLQKQVKERICPNIYEYYGLQESGILTQMKPKDKERKPESVGTLYFNADVRIVDEKGDDVQQGEIGEIIGRGPAVTTGYYMNEEKTKEAFRDGWFHTGDLGRFDEEGFLFLVGRKKDMIISGGQNVFAVEVEDLLMNHVAVMDCTVIGLPDDTWGEMVTAVIVKNPQKEVTEEEIIEFCRERIAHFKAPKRVIFTDNIPRTPTGKVTKYVLVEKYSEKA